MFLIEKADESVDFVCDQRRILIRNMTIFWGGLDLVCLYNFERCVRFTWKHARTAGLQSSACVRLYVYKQEGMDSIH